MGIKYLPVLLIVATPAVLVANPGYGGREGKACIYCHVKVEGGAGLNGNGLNYLKHGHRFPKPDENEKEKNGGGSAPAGGTTSSTGTSSGTTASGVRGGGRSSSRGEKPRPTISETDEERRRRLAVLERVRRQVDEQARRRARTIYRKLVLRGKRIFTNAPPALSVNGKTCSDCHSAAKLSRRRSRYPRWFDAVDDVVTWDRMMRYCIYNRMKGPPLRPESDVIVALGAYLKEVAVKRVRKQRRRPTEADRASSCPTAVDRDGVLPEGDAGRSQSVDTTREGAEARRGVHVESQDESHRATGTVSSPVPSGREGGSAR